MTTLLKQSLGGNSFCLMIATLSPALNFFDETLQTLHYASKALQISNQPKINQDPRSKLILEQRMYIERLNQELRRANSQILMLAS